MLKPLITPILIGSLIVLSLGLVWYETIFKWTLEDNMKFYVEYQCYKPNTFCESQSPLLQMSMLGIMVVGMMITMFCYIRFYPIDNKIVQESEN